MFNKKIIIAFLFIITLAGCNQKEINKNTPVSGQKYIAYYFHPSARCESCLNLEAFLKELIDTKYSNQGLLFKPVNVDEKENQHFKKKYDLTFSSVVLTDSDTSDQGKWIKLDSVWSFTYDKENFFRYTGKEINNFINQN